MDVLRRDVRAALVAMRRAPGFAATALITLALGVGARVDLVRLVMREGLSMAFGGIALGVLSASLFARLMQDLLFGVPPLDAVAFTVGPAILVVASLGACLGPALRAASTDPAVTLRG